MTEPAGSRPITADELDAMPDDGRRRELIDGMLFVTPAPGRGHQEMGLTLAILLRGLCPREMRVLVPARLLDGLRP